MKYESGELVYLDGEVLFSGESFSESTEAMLDQVIQIALRTKKYP